MALPKFVDIDQVLKDVEGLVSSVNEEANRFVFSQAENETPRARLRAMGVEAFEALVEKPRDGSAEIELSSEKMEVLATVYPPVGEGAPLSVDAFELLLERAGVVHGLLPAVYRRILAEAALDRKTAAAVVVARGTPAVDAFPDRWEIAPGLADRKRTFSNEPLTVDLKAVSPFVMVKAGDVLAIRVPGQAGSQGWDVLGRELAFTERNPKVLQPGRNVEARVTGFHATRDGCFKFDDREFWVDEVLVLESGVDYSTGHIDFAGDVHIVGTIAAGFHIHAGGGIHSTRVIDASEILCGGDLTTPFGVVGHEGSVVKVDGRVQARFLENLFLLSRGRVDVQSSVLNCVLQTLDALQMGDKGVVVGGKVVAQNGIDVFQIGTDRATKTEVICGMDFTVLEKLAWARDQSLSLVQKLKTLEAYKGKHPAQRAVCVAACEKIRREVMNLGELSRSLVSKIDKNDDAAIVVRGPIHEGTYLEICHVSYVVPQTVRGTRFVLDKNRGAVRGIPL